MEENIEADPSGKVLRRYPTLKDLEDQIKQLQNENFQLKLRVYMDNERGGSLRPQSSSTSAVESRELIAQFKDFQTMSSTTEVLKSKLTESDNLLRMREKEVENFIEREKSLQNQNGFLHERLEELERDLELMKMKRYNDEMEKCALIAFDAEEEEENFIRDQMEQKITELETKIGTLKSEVNNKNEHLDHINHEYKEEVKKNKAFRKQIKLLNEKVASVSPHTLQSLKEKDKENQRLFQELLSAKEVNEKYGKEITKLREALKVTRPKIRSRDKELQTDEPFFNPIQTNLILEELKLVTQTRDSLVSENSSLLARKSTLEAKLQAMKIDLERSNAIKEEYEKAKKTISELERTLKHLNERMSDMQMDRRGISEKLSVTEAALKRVHHEHSKLVGDLRELKEACPIKLSTYPRQEKPLNSNNDNDKRVDGRDADASPDLGIEVLSDENTEIDYKKENVKLRKVNRDLADKLIRTRHALDDTADRLKKTEDAKHHAEKAICRQLHKTHVILKEAKRSLERRAQNESDNENYEPTIPLVENT